MMISASISDLLCHTENNKLLYLRQDDFDMIPLEVNLIFDV